MCEKTYDKVGFCIAHGYPWESNYTNCDDVMEKYFTTARDFNADIIVMRIGENIDREKNKEISCKPYYEQMIKYLCSENTKQVIITDCFWKIETLYEIFKEVAEENDYTFCKLHDLSEDEANMAIGLFEHEGVSIHQGDLGMKGIAERIVNCIRY